MRTALIAILSLVGLLGSALIIAKPWVTIRHAKPITVKGYAEKLVYADVGSLTASVTATGPTNAEAYEMAGEKLQKVIAVTHTNLVNQVEIVELQTSVREILKTNEKGQKINVVDYYAATRKVRINTVEVEALQKLGRALYDLNSEGIRITLAGPDFFVSNLDPIKLDLVESATTNGKQRAKLMAQSSGETLGALTSAQQGVIQITKKNSSATSSYGIYDTETIEKVVKMVVTLEYEIGG